MKERIPNSDETQEITDADVVTDTNLEETQPIDINKGIPKELIPIWIAVDFVHLAVVIFDKGGDVKDLYYKARELVIAEEGEAPLGEMRDEKIIKKIPEVIASEYKGDEKLNRLKAFRIFVETHGH